MPPTDPSADTADLQRGHRLDALLETAHEAMLVADAAGRITQANAAAARRLGRPPELLVGASLWTLHEGAWDVPALRSLFDDARADEGAPVRAALLGRPAAHVRVRRLEDDDGHRLLCLADPPAAPAPTPSDAVSTFARHVAHELRSPLTALQIGLSWIQQQRTDDDETLMSIVGRGNRTVAHMSDLVAALSAFAHLGMDHVTKAVDLNDALARARAALADDPLDVHVVRPLPAVPGDPELLQALFEHLLRNAARFRCGERTRVTLDVTSDPQGWTVHVQDDGVGFPADEAERIFGLFARAHEVPPAGLGMGLAHARRIAELHGGLLTARSDAGGATFHLTLPGLDG